MDEYKVVDLIYKINELFRKEWFKYKIEDFGKDYEQQAVIDLFTEGNCAIYAELLYKLLKNEGAILGKSEDHVLIKVFDRYFDVVSGYYQNKEKLQKLVDEKGFLEYDLDNDIDLANYEAYKSKCNINESAQKILSDIENMLIEEKKNKITK